MKGFKFTISAMLCAIASCMQVCPYNVFQNGFSNDAVNMINMFKSEKTPDVFDNGVCGFYTQILLVNGSSNSSFVVYKNIEKDVAIGVFYSITTDEIKPDLIKLSTPSFLTSKSKLRKGDDNQSLVVSQFQDIFNSILPKIPESFYTKTLNQTRFLLVSFDTGGALNVFMATYLYYVRNIKVDLVLNLGSPFSGNMVFHNLYVEPLRQKIGYRNWWNMEVVNIINSNDRDTISEAFNRNTKPFIYIDWSSICAAYILPYYDLDIHSPENYKIPLIDFTCD